MYSMVAGIAHGGAMLRSAGIPATEFAARVVPWPTVMTRTAQAQARFIDSGDYRTDVQSQHRNKAGLDAIAQAGRKAGIAVDVL